MLYYDISEERFWEIRMQEAEEIGLRNGFEKGMAKGIENGIDQGIEQGIEKGIEKGIVNSITLCRDLGLTKEQTSEKLNQLYDAAKVASCMEVNWP